LPYITQPGSNENYGEIANEKANQVTAKEAGRMNNTPLTPEQKTTVIEMAQQVMAERAVERGCRPFTAYWDPNTNQCAPVPNCGTGEYFDPELSKCIDPFVKQGIPTWVWIAAGVIGLVLLSSRS
jgi:hypothetical protein